MTRRGRISKQTLFIVYETTVNGFAGVQRVRSASVPWISTRRVELISYRSAAARSVWRKSLPLKSNGMSRLFASAYAKQSP